MPVSKGHCVLLDQLCQPQATQGCSEKIVVRTRGLTISLDSVTSPDAGAMVYKFRLSPEGLIT